MPTRAVACEHAGQCAAVGGWAGGRGLQRVASGAAATAQPPSFALSFLPVGCPKGAWVWC
jgi:hypothetical protein